MPPASSVSRNRSDPSPADSGLNVRSRTLSITSSGVAAKGGQTSSSPRYSAANSSPRLASMSGRRRSASIPAASAASEDTGRSSIPRAWARPRAVATPMRRPVNVPGPTPTAMAPISSQSSPASPITRTSAGISSAAWAGGAESAASPGVTSNASPSWRSKHALVAAVEVSNPSTFIRSRSPAGPRRGARSTRAPPHARAAARPARRRLPRSLQGCSSPRARVECYGSAEEAKLRDGHRLGGATALRLLGLGLRPRRGQQLRQPPEVLAQRGEHRLAAQSRGRVVDRVDRHLEAADRVLLRLAVHARDPVLAPGEQLRGEVSERADHERLDQLDLAREVGLARLDLLGLRIAVARGAALQHVRDEHVVALQLDLRQQLVEQLSRRAHERLALLVLVEAGRLAHEHQVGIGVAGAEDHVGARGV